MAMRFNVTVDGLNLGSWRECKGLSVSMDVEEVWEGGNNQNMHILAKVVKYEKITLTRAMTKKDSKKVQDWLGSKFRGADPGNLSAEGAAAAALSMVPSIISQFIPGATAAITLYDQANTEVYTWHLRNVFPLKWEGPQLDGNGKGIAEEKLTLFHEGFLDSGF
jgi:phage tail-like protein